MVAKIVAQRTHLHPRGFVSAGKFKPSPGILAEKWWLSYNLAPFRLT
jgi:hypothetical protein